MARWLLLRHHAGLPGQPFLAKGAPADAPRSSAPVCSLRLTTWCGRPGGPRTPPVAQPGPGLVTDHWVTDSGPGGRALVPLAPVRRPDGRVLALRHGPALSQGATEVHQHNTASADHRAL